jgi:hypothetical protein
MFKYRPQRGTLEEAMKEEKEFITMDQMFDYIVRSDPFHVLQKEDLSISENLCKDDRIDWSETRNVLTKRYGPLNYETPQAIGWCSMEDFYDGTHLTDTKNIYIGGISRHHLLKMLYDAAKPYDKIISIEEAADVLHNTIGMITILNGKRLYVDVQRKELDCTVYDKINGVGLSYHIIAFMRYHLLYGKYPWELGIPNFDGDRLDVLDKVPMKEDEYVFGQRRTKVEADSESALKSFKTKMAADMEPEFVKLYEDVLKDKSGSTVTTPVQNVYKVTCSVGFDIDLILIRATSEMDAWNKFWKHFPDEPNLNHGDFGSKEDYEYSYGYWKKRGSIVSITIEPINIESDFLYIAGGRNV